MLNFHRFPVQFHFTCGHTRGETKGFSGSPRLETCSLLRENTARFGDLQDSHQAQGQGRLGAPQGCGADPSGGCGFLTCRRLRRETNSQTLTTWVAFSLPDPLRGPPSNPRSAKETPPTDSLRWGRAAFFLVHVQAGLEHWAVGLRSQGARRSWGGRGAGQHALARQGAGLESSWETERHPQRLSPRASRQSAPGPGPRRRAWQGCSSGDSRPPPPTCPFRSTDPARWTRRGGAGPPGRGLPRTWG